MSSTNASLVTTYQLTVFVKIGLVHFCLFVLRHPSLLLPVADSVQLQTTDAHGSAFYGICFVGQNIVCYIYTIQNTPIVIWHLLYN